MEGQKRTGRPPVDRKSISITLPPEMRKRLKIEAIERGTTVSAIVERAVEAMYAEQDTAT